MMPLQTRHLYLETPDNELLQMCFIRPSPREVVTPLPYLIEQPTTMQLPRPSVITASAMLAGGMSSAAEPPAQPEGANTAPSLEAETRAEILLELEQALLNGADLPLSTARLHGTDWREALGAGNALDALAPVHMVRLSRELQSEVLSQLLLSRRFPRLLRCEAAQRVDPAWGPPSDTEPLPGALSDVLLELLHASGLLRLPAAEFDRQVTTPLHNIPGLGRRAAAQAALIYCAAASSQAERGTGCEAAEAAESGGGRMRRRDE